jgi:hypothetical protein
MKMATTTATAADVDTDCDTLSVLLREIDAFRADDRVCPRPEEEEDRPPSLLDLLGLGPGVPGTRASDMLAMLVVTAFECN